VHWKGGSKKKPSLFLSGSIHQLSSLDLLLLLMGKTTAFVSAASEAPLTICSKIIWGFQFLSCALYFLIVLFSVPMDGFVEAQLRSSLSCFLLTEYHVALGNLLVPDWAFVTPDAEPKQEFTYFS
jgi:hypothetical protein